MQNDHYKFYLIASLFILHEKNIIKAGKQDLMDKHKNYIIKKRVNNLITFIFQNNKNGVFMQLFILQ